MVGIEIYDPVVIIGNSLKYGRGCRIDSFVKIECGEKVVLCDFVHIASFVHLGIGGGELFVGSHVGIASGAKVLTGSNTTRGVSMSASSPGHMQVKEKKTTTIDSYALIGAQAVVMPGVTVGEGAVVGAGAVVLHDVPPCAIVAGSPALGIGYRKDLAKELRLDVI